MMGRMPSGRHSTVEFAEAARQLAAAARAGGWEPPSFRCPPGLVGVDRTIRRRKGAPVVAVRIRSRAWGAVIADMIEGVVVANRLEPPESDRARNALWQALSAVQKNGRTAA
jgi:hypothetical protein